MVDYNNETTISTPAIDIVRVSILQKRDYLIEAIESYNKMSSENRRPSFHIVQARLCSYFLQVGSMLKRRWKDDKEKYSFIKSRCLSQETKPDEVYKIFEIIDEELDGVQLIRIDSRVQIKNASIETSNKFKGY